MPTPAAVKAIFLEAAAINDRDAREALLAERCGDDAILRDRVVALLAANEQAVANEGTMTYGDRVATATFGDSSATADFPGGNDRVGAILGGKYKLIEEIGEGGMGNVFMAQQTEPVKRAVAVKVIKAGMDSKAVLARFEAERQALAMMDHPNIARVLDAGTTESGRPYFVMELVKGVPITKFCDERKLTPRQRLELFVPVCNAIQHAHQKGIIHRDIKPSNVMVALYDDRPVPKVIDFGVAKATGQTLTDKTLMTGFGAVVGTPEYMSPEQANMNQLDIDTRSDVYSLGVLMYELLTGTTPVDKKSLGKAAMLEILRIVREVEAPRPSAKLSTIDTLPSVAANRGTEPAKLSKLMKGELDWVVLKALEKDRTRRYDTANGLARDIQRYLADELVEARPPSTGYRLRKFVMRHKGQVIAAGMVLVALVAGVIGTTLGLFEARRQAAIALAQEAEAKKQEGVARDEAAEKERQRGIAEANERKAVAAAKAEKAAKEQEAAQRAVAEKARDRTRDVLDAMVSEVTGDSLATQKAISPEQKKFLESVLGYYRDLADTKTDDESSRARIAWAAFRVGRIESRLGRMEEAKAAYRLACELYASLTADFPAMPIYRVEQANNHQNVGGVLWSLGQNEEAVVHLSKALAIRGKLAADFPDTPMYRANWAASHSGLGLVYQQLGQFSVEEKNLHYATAADHYHKALDIEQKLATEFPNVAVYQLDLGGIHCNLGNLAGDNNDPNQGIKWFSNAIDCLKIVHEKEPRNAIAMEFLLNSYFGRAGGYSKTKKTSEALKDWESAIEIAEKLTTEFPSIPAFQAALGSSYCNFGNLMYDSGHFAGSLKWFGRAIDRLQPVYDKEPRDVSVKQFLFKSNLGRALAHDKLLKYSDAVKDWTRVIALSPPDIKPRYRAARSASLLSAGQTSEAVAEVAELSQLSIWKADAWYNFACVYSVASGKIADKQAEYADRAMELLQKAAAAGWNDVAHMTKDTDLDAIRERADYKKLIAEMEKTATKTQEKK